MPSKKQKTALSFQRFQGANKQWYWRLRSKNNKIVAQSEGYTRERDCVRSILKIQKLATHMAAANVEDIQESTLRSVPKRKAEALTDSGGMLLYIAEEAL